MKVVPNCFAHLVQTNKTPTYAILDLLTGETYIEWRGGIVRAIKTLVRKFTDLCDTCEENNQPYHFILVCCTNGDIMREEKNI